MFDSQVLIFAYHFPPENKIGALRPYRFAKYLRRLGHHCRVFTAVNQDGSDYNAHYVPDPFVTRSRLTPQWQFERLVRRALLPGELGSQWSYGAYRAASQYLRNIRGGKVTILSSSPPIGPHMAAWRLARKHRATWIADFRDPFIDDEKEKRLNPIQRYCRRWLEEAFLNEATAVIANTDAARSLLQERFPAIATKCHAIWNGCDLEDPVPPLPIRQRDYKVLSHVGELYNGRNVSPLLASLARLISRGELLATRVRLRLVGPIADDSLPERQILQRGQSQGWLEVVREQIPIVEARQVGQTSDGLLLLQSQSSVHVPGKLFEYLQIGRPILAFIQRDSPADYLLKRSGVPFRCLYPDSTPELIDDTVSEFFELSSAPVSPSPWFKEQFNAENQTRTLDTLIRHLHGENHLSDGAGVIPMTMTPPVSPAKCEFRVSI